MAESITLQDAANLSNNELIEGIVSDIITEDQWFKFLPFVVFEGLAYTFIRENTLAGVAFAAPGANLNSAKYQKGATFTPVNVNLSAIIGDIIINGQLEDQLSETSDQLAVQISSKSKSMAREYMNAIINAKRSSTLVQSNNGPIGIADKFHGMASILDAEQGNVDDVNHPFYNNGNPTQTLELVEDDPASPRIGKPGRVYTLEDLDDLIDRVTAASPDFILMNKREVRTLRVLLRNTGGGTDSAMIQTQGLGNARPMLMYQEIPVFKNDFISKADPVNTTSHTLSSITNSTDIVLGEATAADAQHLLLRGSDGVLYRYDIVSGAGTANITVDITGSFFDPEQNEVVARVALDSGLFAAPSEMLSAERLDGSSIYCGCWGELKGVTGFTSANNAGMKLEYVGPREDSDAYQYRLKWYVGFDLYNRLALARIKNVLPLS